MSVLLPSPFESHIHLAAESRRSPTTQRYFLDDRCNSPKSPMYDYPSKDCPSPTISSAPSSRTPSPDFTKALPDQLPYSPSTLSSLSLDVGDDDEYEDYGDDGDELVLPFYDQHRVASKDQVTPEHLLDEPFIETPTETGRRKCQIPAADDAAIETEPSRHVDYLSHEWKEEDLWSSWRYTAARKHAYSNGVRLENASWRTWAKYKLNLGTVSPEALNWMKDCDVTWLYGPLKTYHSSVETFTSSSPPPSNIETPGTYRDRKPILKKKSASEMMLQRSLLQHTLLQHAGAILKAQEADHGEHVSALSRPVSEFGRIAESSLGSQTSSINGTLTNTSISGIASPNSGRHIHFNNEVAQCIAVDVKDGEDGHDCFSATSDDDSSSYDGVSMMKQIFPDTPLNTRSPSRNGVNAENKTIAPLPSTKLKCRGDTPEPPSASFLGRWYGRSSASISSPTHSGKTVRPTTPHANFLLDDEDDGYDGLDSWQSQSHTFNFNRNSSWLSATDEEFEIEQNMASMGNILPSEDGESSDGGIVDKVVDAVNTARDIAHVIWNVGWRG